MRISLDVKPGVMLADPETRTIRGLAIPTGATFLHEGKPFTFAAGCDITPVNEWAVPLLAYHDSTKPLGLMIESDHTDAGYAVGFRVSNTVAGSEALQLANDGVLGLSVGIDVDTSEDIEGTTSITSASLHEISLTPTPALSGARVTSVALARAQEATTEALDRAQEATTEALARAQDAMARLQHTMSAPTEGKNMPDIDTSASVEVELSTPQGPVNQPVPRATITAEASPYSHIFGGQVSEFSLSADLRASMRGSGEATERLDRHIKLAVDSGDLGRLPNQRPDLTPTDYDFDRPMTGLVSTGTISDNTPFQVPRWEATAPSVVPHTEGDPDPVPDGAIVATRQTITPTAVIGRTKITREAFDSGGSPRADAMLWSRMLVDKAYQEEVRIVEMLEASTADELPVASGDDSVDSVVGIIRHLNFTKDGLRFRSLALNEDHYTDLSDAKDTTGRRLLSVLGATNADGTQSNNYGTLVIGNTRGIGVHSLTDTSFLIDPSTVWSWVSPVQRFDLQLEVSHVNIGLFAYQAVAITDVTGIRKLV